MQSGDQVTGVWSTVDGPSGTVSGTVKGRLIFFDADEAGQPVRRGFCGWGGSFSRSPMPSIVCYSV